MYVGWGVKIISISTLLDELELKLKLKRIGSDEAKSETQELIAQTTTAMAELDESAKEYKKKFNALTKDKAELE